MCLTNSRVEKLSVAKLVKNIYIVEPVDPLLCLREPFTVPYPKPVQPILYLM
jgi:hypothetical protein